MERFYLESLEDSAAMKGLKIKKCALTARVHFQNFSAVIYLHLHAAQYRSEKSNHTQVFDNINCLNRQLLQDRRDRKQYRATETEHVANELILSWLR